MSALSRTFRPAAGARSRRFGVTAAVAVALAATVTGAPAHASGGLNASLNCQSAGNGRWFCQTSAGGGTGAYSYTYSGVLNIGSIHPDGAIATGTCYANHNAEVAVTVTDSASATATAYGSFFCGEAP